MEERQVKKKINQKENNESILKKGLEAVEEFFIFNNDYQYFSEKSRVEKKIKIMNSITFLNVALFSMFWVFSVVIIITALYTYYYSIIILFIWVFVWYLFKNSLKKRHFAEKKQSKLLQHFL